MGDLRPLGSEKMQGIDKLKRIMEIARYNEVPKQEINELSTTNYTVNLADGKTYGIVKERTGYIIKCGLNESDLDYNNPIRQRKYYRSYSEAMKKLNLMAGELNRVYGNEDGIPLIGEQSEPKKKFILKTPKPKTTNAPAPPMDMGVSEPKTPAADLGTPPAPAPAMDTDVPPPTNTETPPMDDMSMGMGGEMPPAEAEPIDGETPPMDDMSMGMGDDMGSMDNGDDEEGPVGLKTIQKLTGRLSQKLRTIDKDQGMDSQDIKYVINSIISAIDLSKLDEDDKEDILNKFDSFEDYGMGDEGDLNMKKDTDFGMGNFGMDDMSMGDEGTEPKSPTFNESTVDKVLSSYFKISADEKPILEEKRKRNFLNEKLKRLKVIKEIETLSESHNQEIAAKKLMSENSDIKFIGKTNKENLLFTLNGKQVKVTERGRVL